MYIHNVIQLRICIYATSTYNCRPSQVIDNSISCYLGNPQLRVSVSMHSSLSRGLVWRRSDCLTANSSSIVSNGLSHLATFFAECEFVNSRNSHSATSFYHWCNRCCPAWELHRFHHTFLLQILQVLIELLPLFNVTKSGLECKVHNLSNLAS